jgi:pimeloyl-ACP methyl ester carboxylesterase
MVGDRVEEFAARAKNMVEEGRGRELMLMPGWWYAISAESFLDRLTETPDVLELAPRVKCPSLFVRGDREPRDAYPAEEFRARASGPCAVEIVPDCDHFYNGREEAVRDIVSSWLARALNVAPVISRRD